jgi:predicted S18 family serine protease
MFVSWSLPPSGNAAPGTDTPIKHIRAAIPILGTTMNEQSEQVGIVAEIQLEFLQRQDHEGLCIQFLTTPGKFSPYAQQSVKEALERVVEVAGLNPDSWTIRFILPYPGVTLYGESLSAMAALNVIALAKNDPVDEETVLTGTITPDGHVGTVGGVPLKILAAYEQHYRRVLIPEEPDVADGDWETPFMMEVTPVRSIKKAYLALTHRPLRSQLNDQPLAAKLSH